MIIITPSNADKINLNQWQLKISKKVINWLQLQLQIAGLELKQSKTRVITNESFDFLGYEIQRGKGVKLGGKVLFQRQTGLCPHGGLKFTLTDTEKLETPHLNPTGQGGKDTNKNVGLFHGQCHKLIHLTENLKST